jgi:rare lipoprotein A (peptidoglycan hydrolase)
VLTLTHTALLKRSTAVVIQTQRRGAFTTSGVIDVSRAAARELDMISAGTTMVTIERQ